jgi:uncharacterized membrane protein YhdT
VLKFKQANREAKATVVATILVIIVLVCGRFRPGGQPSHVFTHPALGLGRLRRYLDLFRHRGGIVLARYVFMDMSLDADKEVKDHE